MAKKDKGQTAGGEVLRNAAETAQIEQYWHLLGRAKPRKPPREYNYVEELAYLQLELIKLQEWVRMQGLRVCVLFEGRDAAGKGGVIKRITQSLNHAFAAW
jgi:polyphosphate kinase 2 (PPK2 family)